LRIETDYESEAEHKFEIEELAMIKKTSKEVWVKVNCDVGDYVAYVE
jgi:hypothetical protein